jgi:hypothetical protein
MTICFKAMIFSQKKAQMGIYPCIDYPPVIFSSPACVPKANDVDVIQYRAEFINSDQRRFFMFSAFPLITDRHRGGTNNRTFHI